MPLCPNCSRTFDEGAAVCPYCGATLKPPAEHQTGSSGADKALGGGLGCFASVLVTLLDIYIVSALSPGFEGKMTIGIYLAIQFGAMIALIWFCAWALRRGVSPAMRSGLLTFTVSTAIALGLIASCMALLTGTRFN